MWASTRKSGLSIACKQYSKRQLVSPDAGGLREKQVRKKFCPSFWEVGATMFCCTGVVQVCSAASSLATASPGTSSVSDVVESDRTADWESDRSHSCIGDSTAGTA